MVKAIGFSSHGSRSMIRQACRYFDIDVVLVTTNDPGNANFKPDIPEIVDSGVAVVAMKVMRHIEGRGSGSGGREYYREVLRLPISTAVIHIDQWKFLKKISYCKRIWEVNSTS